jgi:hypothetical protein
MAVAEVAAHLGVSKQATTFYWTQRSDFPAPVAFLRMGSVWATDAIVKFKADMDARRLSPRRLSPPTRASATYRSWDRMIQRCTNPRNISWKYYGGRVPPVAVCERWLTFENFLADMGERPKGTTLGRFGDVGDYEPSNCKWMTPEEQAANRRRRAA